MEIGAVRSPGRRGRCGPLVVVWDGLNTHVSHAMADLVAESVWSYLKRSLANLAKRDISQLTALVKTRLRRMQHRPGLLDGFLADTGLDFRPLPYPPQLKSVLAVLPGDGCSRGVP